MLNVLISLYLSSSGCVCGSEWRVYIPSGGVQLQQGASVGPFQGHQPSQERIHGVTAKPRSQFLKKLLTTRCLVSFIRTVRLEITHLVIIYVAGIRARVSGHWSKTDSHKDINTTCRDSSVCKKKKKGGGGRGQRGRVTPLTFHDCVLLLTCFIHYYEIREERNTVFCLGFVYRARYNI